MADVITVNRIALYQLLSTFTLGEKAVINLASKINEPGNPIAVLVEEFNLNLEYRQNRGQLKVVKT